MRRYQKGMVLMVEHILFAVLTAAVTMKKQILEMKKKGTKLL